MKRLCLLIFLLSIAPATAQYGQVVMNGAVVSPQVLNLIAQRYNTNLPSGRYWYDKNSGAWGYEGSGTQGFVQAGFGLYAPMPPQISGGNTGVYINGRHLPASDLQALQSLTGPVQPGNYWLDSQGNAGYVGGPAIVNLRQLAGNQGMYRQGSGVGQNYSNGGGSYRNSNTGIGVITDGQGGATVFTR
jgi:hypothetical protein